MSNRSDHNYSVWSIIFFVWPLLPFFYSITHFGKKHYRVFIIIFITFYGLTLVTDAAGDSSRHADRFSSYEEYTGDDYIKVIKDVLTLNSTFYSDLYLYTVNFFVSRFSNDSKYAFALHALIFAFFLYWKLRIAKR